MESFEEIYRKWENKVGEQTVDKDETLDCGKNDGTKTKKDIPCIDLHGLNRYDAIIALSNFIEKNQKSHEIKIKIIHGAGVHSKNGIVILKRAVKDYLSNHSSVRYHRPGKIGEGSQGVTIAFIIKKG